MNKEKRELILAHLNAYCSNTQCHKCPLDDLCGCDCRDFDGCEDTELQKMYDIAFGNSVNHPLHYCREDAMESIDEMIEVFGTQVVSNFCLCNVWKYRYRAGQKENGIEDLKKSDWYMKKYMELKQND